MANSPLEQIRKFLRETRSGVSSMKTALSKQSPRTLRDVAVLENYFGSNKGRFTAFQENFTRFGRSFFHNFSSVFSEKLPKAADSLLNKMDKLANMYASGNVSHSLKEVISDRRLRALIDIFDMFLSTALGVEEELKKNRKIVLAGLAQFGQVYSHSREDIDNFASTFVATLSAYNMERDRIAEMLSSYVESGGDVTNLISDFIREPELSDKFMRTLAEVGIDTGVTVDTLLAKAGVMHQKFALSTQSQEMFLRKLSRFSRMTKIPLEVLSNYIEESSSGSGIFGDKVDNSLKLLNLMRQNSRSAQRALQNSNAYAKDKNPELLELGLIKILGSNSEFSNLYVADILQSLENKLATFEPADYSTVEYKVLEKLRRHLNDRDMSKLDAEALVLLKDFIGQDQSFLAITYGIREVFGNSRQTLLQMSSLENLDPSMVLFYSDKISEDAVGFFKSLSQSDKTMGEKDIPLRDYKTVLDATKTIDSRVSDVLAQLKFDSLRNYISDFSDVVNTFLSSLNSASTDTAKNTNPKPILKDTGPEIVRERSFSRTQKREIWGENFDVPTTKLPELDSSVGNSEIKIIPEFGTNLDFPSSNVIGSPNPISSPGMVNRVTMDEITEKTRRLVDKLSVQKNKPTSAIIIDKRPLNQRDLTWQYRKDKDEKVF